MNEDMEAEAFLEKAYLEAASPETVYRHLQDNAPKGPYDGRFSSRTLEALRSRNDTLVDIALGRFTSDHHILRGLFDSADPVRRCAVLANPLLGECFSGGLSPKFFTDEELKSFLATAPFEQLDALLRNPSTHPEVLEGVFNRSFGLASKSDRDWALLVLLAAHNPRLAWDTSSFDDVDAWFRNTQAAKAAWSLLNTLPVERWIVQAPTEICSRIPLELPSGGPAPQEFFTRVLSRWRDSDEVDSVSGDDAAYWGNTLGHLRTLIASKAPLHNVELCKLLKNSKDPFIREGYYHVFWPVGLDDSRALFARDGLRFLRGAVRNKNFYAPPHLEFLRELIRGVSNDDFGRRTTQGSLLRDLRRMEEHLAKQGHSDLETRETGARIGAEAADHLANLLEAASTGTREHFDEMRERFKEAAAQSTGEFRRHLDDLQKARAELLEGQSRLTSDLALVRWLVIVLLAVVAIMRFAT